VEKRLDWTQKDKEIKMKKKTVLILLVLLLASVIVPASAMIGGADDTEHTNVGAIVMAWPKLNEPIGRLCTATLIHPRALVTAAHCYPYFVNQGITYDQIWVSFDQDPLADDATHLGVEAFIPHPDFQAGVTRFNDIALVILEVEVPNFQPLPDPGYMDEVVSALGGSDRQGMELILVGFGAPDLLPLPARLLEADRRVGTVTFKSLLPWEILTSNSGQDDVTNCHGDSGGAVFHVDQLGNETLVAVNTTRIDHNPCDADGPGLSFKYRLDTASAQGFINANLP
jgi:hypothetical protein